LIVSAITSPFESLIWTSYGVPYVHTTANWANVTFHAEAYMRAAVGTTHYRYYNLTDAVAVAGSDLSTASATMVLQRTGALTLVTGKTYEHQFARSVAGAGEKQYAMLLGIPI
jgi:hypothetical protein